MIASHSVTDTLQSDAQSDAQSGHLTINGKSLCLSVLRLSRQPFIRSTSHLAGVLLRTQGSAVLSVKLFGWAVLEKAASSNTGGQAIGLLKTKKKIESLFFSKIISHSCKSWTHLSCPKGQWPTHEFLNKAKIDCKENIQTGLRRQICTGIRLSSTSADKNNGQIYQLVRCLFCLLMMKNSWLRWKRLRDRQPQFYACMILTGQIFQGTYSKLSKEFAFQLMQTFDLICICCSGNTADLQLICFRCERLNPHLLIQWHHTRYKWRLVRFCWVSQPQQCERRP